MKHFNPTHRNGWDVSRIPPDLSQTAVFLFMAALLLLNVGLYGALVAGMMPAASPDMLCTDWGLAGP